MIVKGERCTLRPWRSDDADALLSHANNISVAKQLRDRFPHPYTRTNAIAFLKHCVSVDPPTNFAIQVGAEAVGGIGFVPGNDIERYSAEIGYWLGEQHWGRGIATEALVLATTHAFDRFNLLRLFALPFADNLGSLRVLEKAGYVREGILKASCVKYGHPRDQALYARINSAWQAM